MISILIPTKDYDCHLLVEELHRQCEESGLPYEILLGEDGTSATNLQKNLIADTLPHCRRIISDCNIGRASIRNLLASNAIYPYIIFIDSDAVVEKKDYIKSYINVLRNHDVVCGGLYHCQHNENRLLSLRFKYEKNADKKRNATTRNIKPYNNFTTFNFAIRRDLFLSILFNGKIEEYGYEDVLFGKELERRRVNILHIDNKLMHNGLEENSIFLKKTEQSIRTLVQIEDLINETALLNASRKIKNLHLEGIFIFIWKHFHQNIKKNLLGRNPNLMLFHIYKLGLYYTIKQQNNNIHQ